MLPTPLHPAIVHFPIVLVILLPFIGLGALWAIRRGAAPWRAWAVPVAFAAALSLSAWVAVETGEQEEEKVESVVAERTIDRHAEMAEQFLMLSAALLVLSATGFLRGRAGSVLRGVATVASLGLVAAGVRVGHSGGSLVYTHGAAAAYATPGAAGDAVARGAGGERDGEREERGERPGTD